MTDRHLRLRTARVNAGYTSARGAAQRFGWSPSTYAAHENGQNDFNDEAAYRYAKAFRVKPMWLFFGQEASDTDSDYNFLLAGEIRRDGDVIILSENDPDRTIDIQTTLKISKDAKLFIFNDDSHFPRYQERDILVTSEWKLGYPENVDFRQDCICYLGNGATLLRRPQPTAELDVYDLHLFNSPVVITEKLVKVGAIVAVLKRIAYRAFIPGKDGASRLIRNDQSDSDRG